MVKKLGDGSCIRTGLKPGCILIFRKKDLTFSVRENEFVDLHWKHKTGHALDKMYYMDGTLVKSGNALGDEMCENLAKLIAQLAGLKLVDRGRDAHIITYELATDNDRLDYE